MQKNPAYPFYGIMIDTGRKAGMAVRYRGAIRLLRAEVGGAKRSKPNPSV
jgi:hypothetical protein